MKTCDAPALVDAAIDLRDSWNNFLRQEVSHRGTLAAATAGVLRLQQLFQQRAAATGRKRRR